MVAEEISGPVSAASAEAQMAADNPAEGSSWEEIVHALRTAEEGRPGATEVQLRPGGQLVLTGQGRDPQPLSRLPKSRMAAVNRAPAIEDVQALQQLDPANTEQWSPVVTSQISGWAFQMSPPFAGQPPFVFFAFRSPSDGNAYRIAVLEPDMDDEYGHRWHMIATHVGGRRVPVICGPSGKPARDLATVRLHAAKWMTYVSALLADRPPGFSQ
jgi:hypothetical protein